MTTLLLSLLLSTASMPDSIPQHYEPEDTLGEVEVRPDSVLQVLEALKQTLKTDRQPKSKSLGDILDKYAPQLQDKMLHPFAIKDRKQERKRKRDKEVLKEYDRAKTPNELLEEALRKEGLGHIIDERKK